MLRGIPCRERYRAVRVTMPCGIPCPMACGIPCRAGIPCRCGNTVPCGIPCRAGIPCRCGDTMPLRGYLVVVAERVEERRERDREVVLRLGVPHRVDERAVLLGLQRRRRVGVAVYLRVELRAEVPRHLPRARSSPAPARTHAQGLLSERASASAGHTMNSSALAPALTAASMDSSAAAESAPIDGSLHSPVPNTKPLRFPAVGEAVGEAGGAAGGGARRRRSGAGSPPNQRRRTVSAGLPRTCRQVGR